MYLKSLTLKGFKSFADKTHMEFDPGLTVVVGPNGSGKSNVSDSILWVLGEQSAKMLRGQAMEDVIFSGSSARNAVGVAEVTLLLDNSDHTLPIDFSEIGITRRMYRSGESEYLINGAPARLMDIQDILHDSGLGKDTHSIISQGKLDSILSSRPEQRRELIEEAADISKHRRRKERAERKIAAMDENLARAKVVAREITRQLRPLEKQVDKASRAKTLQAQFTELTVQLAVDDLRQLQQTHAELSVRQKEADAAIELARYRSQEKVQELEKLQSLLEQKGLFVGDLGEQRRRMQDVLGRMGSDMRLLEEKGKNMVSRLSDMRMQLSVMGRQRQEAATESEQLKDQLIAFSAQETELKKTQESLQEIAQKAASGRKELDLELQRLSSEEKSARAVADRETLAYVKLEEHITHAKVEDEMYVSRLAQINESLKTAEEALSQSSTREHELSAALELARRESEALIAEISEHTSALEAARAVEADAKRKLSQAEATLTALTSLDVETAKTSPRAAALADDEAVAELIESRLADCIDADERIEPLLERLLGDDLAAFVVGSVSEADTLASAALAYKEAEGCATIVSRAARCSESAERIDKDAPGEALLDRIHVAESSRALLEALFGSMRVVGDVSEALAAHEKASLCTYVTLDGAILFPDGRLRIGTPASAKVGALERKRRIRALEKDRGHLKAAHEAAIAAVAQAETKLATAREKSVAAQGEAARLSGELTSLSSERGRLEGQVASAKAEKSQVTKARAVASERAQDAHFHIEEHRQASHEASERAEELARLLSETTAKHDKAIHAQGKATRELSDARMKLAMATERRANLDARAAELAKRVQTLEQQINATEQSSHALDVIRLRVDPLYERYEALHGRALEWASRLKDRASLAEADSDSLRKTIGEAKDAVSAAQAELEQERSRANDVKVEIGRLEVQVENAINAIIATGAVLDEALKLPEPEDRAAAERTVDQLKRQLDGIGPVNEVAMDEYQRLKERADYIGEQVADLEAARGSLKKITSAIERKMRNRFLVVFEKVNQNFSEIFSMLFPGGHARIEMTDPENLSETGIEIVAQPRGKRITKMMLMSGGEKSLTALALLFAVYRTRTVPFYVFDEVEAALDDANLSKLLDAIEQLKETTQLIVISHQRRTMEQADVLYGVSMQADGVSHVVSQRLDHTTGKVVDA